MKHSFYKFSLSLSLYQRPKTLAFWSPSLSPSLSLSRVSLSLSLSLSLCLYQRPKTLAFWSPSLSPSLSLSLSLVSLSLSLSPPSPTAKDVVDLAGHWESWPFCRFQAHPAATAETEPPAAHVYVIVRLCLHTSRASSSIAIVHRSRVWISGRPKDWSNVAKMLPGRSK